MSAERLLEISTHYLHELQASQRVSENVSPQDIERLVIGGLEQLVSRFNATRTEDPLYNYSPGIQRLKRLLYHDHVDALPLPSQITAFQFMAGLKAARVPMLCGQQIKEGTLSATDSNKKAAILVPSLNTSDIAIAVGTGLHIYERAVMIMMTQLPSNYWWLQDKDVVLHALEDVALWMGPDALLFSLITTPPTAGGLGWKSPEQARTLLDLSPHRKPNYLRHGATGRRRKGL